MSQPAVPYVYLWRTVDEWQEEAYDWWRDELWRREWHWDDRLRDARQAHADELEYLRRHNAALMKLLVDVAGHQMPLSWNIGPDGKATPVDFQAPSQA